jgi:DNA-binding transcriptional MerR regulator
MKSSEQVFPLEELVSRVQAWCAQHGVRPANGQAAETISERTIRFYRTMDLVDPPVGGTLGGFTEKHRLQIIAIRLLQAQGLPLRRIRELLYGRSFADLREIERRGLDTIESVSLPAMKLAEPEQWVVMPLNEEYLLVCRRGHPLPLEVLRKMVDLIQTVRSETSPKQTPNN